MEDIEKKKIPKSCKITIIVAIVVLALIVLSAIVALIVYCSNFVGYSDSFKFVAGEGCSDFYYNHLSVNQQKLYRMIYKEADDALHSEKHIYTLGVYKYSDYGLTKEEAVTVWYALRYDASSLFVISNSYLSLPDAITVNVASEFSDKDARQNVLDKLQKSVEQVKALLSGIDDETLKFKIIYDYIIDNTFYQTDKNERDVYNGYTYSIAGALDGDENTGSICQGYARTVSYLCNMFGLECIYVGSESASHALNIVNIKGNWYYADANTEDRVYNLNYKYFLNGYDGFWMQICKSGDNSSRDFLMDCLPEIEEKPYGGALVNGALSYSMLNRSNCSVVGCSSSAKSVLIPSKIANMTVRVENSKAFSKCYDLESLAVEEDNSLYKSEGNCIIDKRTNLLVAGCKNSIIPEYVTELGAYSFAGCKSLTRISIPDCVTNIGEYAFYSCGNLEEIFIPSGVTIIGAGAFDGCGYLTLYCQASKKPDGWDISLDGNRQVVWSCLGGGIADDGIKWILKEDREVEIIGFIGESNQVVIPSVIDGYDVKSIKYHAFYNRGDLISLYIPSSITRIESSAIWLCRKMVIYCQASRKPDGWELNLNDMSKTVVWNCSTDGYGVTQDGFQWCLPAQGIMTITGYVGSDTQIELPTSINGHIVTRIAERAFRDLDYLISITIPRSVTSIGKSAFYSCDNLSIYCEAESQPSGWEDWWNDGRPVAWNCKNHGITDSGIKWSLTADDAVVITGYIGESNYVEIPGEINGRQVTNIGENAFNQYDNLTGIIIPLTIKVIPEFTFSGCNSLTIYCEAESRPEGWSESWNHSYWPVVWDCKNNEIADDGYIYYIADDGIRYALKDGEAKIARQSKTIGGDLAIPDSILYKGTSYKVTSIGVNAFYDCAKLTGIEIPDSVTSIDARAFSRCINLTKVKIANGVTSIGNQAFNSCDALKKIVIPDSVVQIDDNAFRGCFDLTIYCQAESKPSDWGEDWNLKYILYDTEEKFYFSVIWGYKGE